MFKMTKLNKLILNSSLIIFGIIFFLMTFYIIPAGERGVLLTFGKPSLDAVQEGLHFKIPFAQTIKKFEVRTTKIETDADSASKDLQDVQTIIFKRDYEWNKFT